MTSSPSRSRSADIPLAALVAAAIGFADAALVAFGLGGARGAFQFVPLRMWIAGPATWLVIGLLLACSVRLATSRWAGVVASALLIALFLGFRLRSHPALLLGAAALSLAAIALLHRTAAPWAGRFGLRTAHAIAGALACAAMIVEARSAAHAVMPARSTVDAPNVILIFLDTVRYDAIFDAGGRVHANLATLSRLRGESMAFTQAYAASPWTLPSHLSAVTGLLAHELGVSFDAQVYARPDQTLAERFRNRGYRTAAVISNSFLNAGTGFARGFDTFEQAEAGLDVCRTAPGVIGEKYWPWFSAAVCNWTASEVTRRARSVMDDESGPFFLTLNYMDAHEPYYVERSCAAGRGYDAAVQCLDRQLAPIVDWRSPRRSTVLVLTADHGEQFGEHALARHGNSLYVQLLHVPLMVRMVSREPAERPNPISLAALPSLLGMVPAAPDAPVRSMLLPPSASGLPAEWSALDGRWHLIVRERGLDALYHLADDPGEERNVLDASSGDEVSRLRGAIAEMRRAPKPDLSRFRSVGYIH
jgi:sulfatase-like protein